VDLNDGLPWYCSISLEETYCNLAYSYIQDDEFSLEGWGKSVSKGYNYLSWEKWPIQRRELK
jgi:hypothetical protein